MKKASAEGAERPQPSEWRVAVSANIQGYPAIQNRYNKDDVQIFGSRGVVLQTGPDSYRAVITNARIYNELAVSFNLPPTAVNGEENILQFKGIYFDQIIKAIGASRSRARQIEFSQRFSTPNKNGLYAVQPA